MDTTLNYQALALEIISAAIEDTRSEDFQAATTARRWLETVDMQSLGIDAGIIDAHGNLLNYSDQC